MPSAIGPHEMNRTAALRAGRQTRRLREGQERAAIFFPALV